jgi:hypothetical protein
MMSDLEQELREAIEAQVDPETQPRLLRALPSLLEGIASWGGPAPGEHVNDDVFVAVATQDDCLVFVADLWPAYDEQQAAKLSKGDLALTVWDNLIPASSDEGNSNILTALTMLLGPEGLRQQQQEAEQIRSEGGVPLVVALLDRQTRTSRCW